MAWDGFCPTGKHGLDFKGQQCDICAGEGRPRVRGNFIEGFTVDGVWFSMRYQALDFARANPGRR